MAEVILSAGLRLRHFTLMKNAVTLLLIFFCALLSEERFDSLFTTPIDTDTDSTTLSAMATAITAHERVTATYVQEKEMEALNKPLTSTGILSFVKDSVIVWNQQVPFEEKIEITPDGKVTITDEFGDVSVSENESMADRMGKMMNTLFSAEFSSVERLFEIYLQESDSTWTMGMKPKRASMKRGFTSVVMICSKNGFVNEVILTAPAGATAITFTPSEKKALAVQ